MPNIIPDMMMAAFCPYPSSRSITIFLKKSSSTTGAIMTVVSRLTHRLEFLISWSNSAESGPDGCKSPTSLPRIFPASPIPTAMTKKDANFQNPHCSFWGEPHLGTSLNKPATTGKATRYMGRDDISIRPENP